MVLAGFILPQLSEYDPPAAGEGSLDPMGLAALSDRLADRLVPGVRARMQHIRFVTAMAVASTACEPLADTVAADEVSTPAICFEWLLIEAFVRRIEGEFPAGIPGSQKARNVIARQQRLSAATYLKAPSVFGFHGVLKPFAVDAQVVGSDLEPGIRSVELTRAWEHDQGFEGFTDGVPETPGGNLRRVIQNEVRKALEEGRCVTSPRSWTFGHLARSLRPDDPGPSEKKALRALIFDSPHEQRSELAHLIDQLPELSEAKSLQAVRPRCSPTLGRLVDAVVAYERFAALLDTAFRTLCWVSYSLGSQPITPNNTKQNETIVACAKQLAPSFKEAAERLAAVGFEKDLDDRVGEFAIPHSPQGLVQALLTHHEQVQLLKGRDGKRPWFEPLRAGYVVRPPYGSADPPELGPWFVHPVRIYPLRQFLEATR